MDNFLQLIQWMFLFGCVLPIIVTVILAGLVFYFGQQWVADFINPDLPKLHEDMQKIKSKKPHISKDELVQKIINKQAFKCGIVGAVTGFGGFVTLPITLPIDLLLTARYQATMVSFIAQVHGFENSVENKAATYAVMTGSTEVSKATTVIFRKYAPRLIGKSFSKLIPVLGALIAFLVNYFMTRSMAKAADLWYQGEAREVVLARLGAMTES